MSVIPSLLFHRPPPTGSGSGMGTGLLIRTPLTSCPVPGGRDTPHLIYGRPWLRGSSGARVQDDKMVAVPRTSVSSVTRDGTRTSSLEESIGRLWISAVLHSRQVSLQGRRYESPCMSDGVASSFRVDSKVKKGKHWPKRTSRTDRTVNVSCLGRGEANVPKIHLEKETLP